MSTALIFFKKLKLLHFPLSRFITSNRFFNSEAYIACNSNVNQEYGYLSGNDPEILQLMKENFQLHPDFISDDEEQSLMNEIEPIFKRRRYEYDHWDGAIHGYKETEKLNWNERNTKILNKLRQVAFPPSVLQLQHVHVLDLAKNGYIKPHIDSVRFCGDTIAGLSLLSPSVMRLVKDDDKRKFVDILLHRRSLYIMKAEARYKFTHEILEEKVSFFKDAVVQRGRRISVICRNKPSKDSN